jgi:asparagine synthase (glutamine-hydrolysing)
MCGIAGGFSLENERLDCSFVKNMTDAIFHRGPDGEGCWINEEADIALGHRRLSIIDLSHAGDQPMHYMNRYVIVFNGEIYNYVELRSQCEKRGYNFKSHTDTEVILALFDWRGKDCLQEMDGMFAFAIWDREKHSLFCARDRFGEKPFYYTIFNGIFYFGSEMKALWAAGVPKKTDDTMVYSFIVNSLVDSVTDKSKTFFQGIKKLPASHYFTLKKGENKVTPYRYWNIDLNKKINDITIDEAKQKVYQLMLTSIKRRLRSDVPVGSSLSGGVDSSVLVYMIDQLNPDKKFRQKTFSAQFPGYIKDESRFQEMVIDQCNVEPYFVKPSAESLMQDLHKVIYHQEEPFQHASMVAQYEVYKLAKENNVIVLLDGQGADEVTAGYHYFFQAYFNGLKKAGYAELSEVKNRYYTLHADNNVNVETSKTGVKALLNTILPGFTSKLRGYKHKFEAEKYFNNAFLKKNACSDRKREVFHNLDDAMYYDTFNYGLENLLRYADRNSMAHSREVRLPFLFHELVDFLFSLPDNLKLRDGWTKWILRAIFDQKLPDEIIWRKEKVGYEPPQETWLKQENFKKEIQNSVTCLADHRVFNSADFQKMSPHFQWKVFMTANTLYS